MLDKILYLTGLITGTNTRSETRISSKIFVKVLLSKGRMSTGLSLQSRLRFCYILIS